ncbi:hypothetical protein ES703_70561 [subsurface metagenome]
MIVMIAIGYMFLLIGAAFIFVGVLGVLRMPDLFQKLQAGTKASTIGLLSIIMGVFFMHPGWWARLLLIAFFIVPAKSIGTHNLSRAAYCNREQMVDADEGDTK